MKTLVKLFFIASTLFVAITGCSYPFPKEEQEKLAKQLGVRMDDYPPTLYFPVGYYQAVLKPGISFEEIHEMIIGYRKVLQCENYAEVYYYFDSSDKSALRFEVFYDKSGNLT